VRSEPSRSVVGISPTDAEDARGLIDDVPALTGRQKFVLVLFAGAFAVMIYGFIPWNDLWQEGWGKDFPLWTFGSFYFPEAAALVSGLVRIEIFPVIRCRSSARYSAGRAAMLASLT